MTQEKNPLDSLILKKDLNKDILASILDGFIKINPDSGEIMLLPNYSKLKNKEQIIIILLSFKALKELGLREKEDVSPKEIERVSQLSGGTSRWILRDLVAERTLICEKSKYKVPNFILHNIKDKFEKIDLEVRSKKEKKGIIGKVGKTRKDFSRIKSILESEQKFSDNHFSFLVETKGKYLKKALLVLKMAKDKFGIDGLTSSEITEILRNKIRVPRIQHSNVSLFLGKNKNSRFVFRDKDKEGYIYKLTKIGEDFIRDLKFKENKNETTASD